MHVLCNVTSAVWHNPALAHLILIKTISQISCFNCTMSQTCFHNQEKWGGCQGASPVEQNRSSNLAIPMSVLAPGLSAFTSTHHSLIESVKDCLTNCLNLTLHVLLYIMDLILLFSSPVVSYFGHFSNKPKKVNSLIYLNS